jgi:hypothetical protein
MKIHFTKAEAEQVMATLVQKGIKPAPRLMGDDALPGQPSGGGGPEAPHEPVIIIVD